MPAGCGIRALPRLTVAYGTPGRFGASGPALGRQAGVSRPSEDGSFSSLRSGLFATALTKLQCAASVQGPAAVPRAAGRGGRAQGPVQLGRAGA